MREYLACKAAGIARPVPIEYIAMIALPERGICSYEAWKRLSVAERDLLLFMLEIEADPMYQPKARS